MRCNICEYNQNMHGNNYEENACETCPLTNENEWTENEYGIGCRFNKKTLDKRWKMAKQEMDEYFENGGMP